MTMNKMQSHTRALSILTLALTTALAAPSADADVVIASGFDLDSNTAPVNIGLVKVDAGVLAGTNYQIKKLASTVSDPTVDGSLVAAVGGNDGAYVPLGSVDLTNQVLSISADLRVGDIVTPPTYARGVGLGFQTDMDTEGSGAGFKGLILTPDGILRILGDSPLTYVEFAGGTFDTDAFYTLSYDVNTSTGKLSNISLSGSTADYSTLEAASTGFSGTTNLAFAGFHGSSGVTVANEGSVRNFELSSNVPEPGSLALIGLGGLCLIRRRRG